LGLLIRQWSGIEAGDPAAIGRYPIDSAPSLEQVVDEGMGQSLFDTISGEFVTVESAQAVCGAEPEETMRVPNDAQDKIARQSIGSRIGAHRKLLGGHASRAEKERKRQGRNQDNAAQTMS